MAKLYVGNLPYTTDNQQLSDMFAPFGAVVSANIIMDKFSGKSKGFGFVELDTDQSAEAAIAQLNGSEIDGRKIIVSIARPREDRPPGGGGGGGRRDFGNKSFGGRRDDRRSNRF